MLSMIVYVYQLSIASVRCKLVVVTKYLTVWSQVNISSRYLFGGIVQVQYYQGYIYTQGKKLAAVDLWCSSEEDRWTV